MNEAGQHEAGQAPEPAGIAAARWRYARDVARMAGTGDERVQSAFAAVPRQGFLPAPPWRIFSPGGLMEAETSDPRELYRDVLVVLDRGKGINNGQPSLHAGWIAAVNPKPGETVVAVGTGAGYYTAILAQLVGETGQVVGYEVEPGLAAMAARNLAGLRHVTVRAASAVGEALPEADVVYVAAGRSAPDLSWLLCLREGGRLIFPWQPDLGSGLTALLTRVGRAFRVELGSGVAFIPCVGTRHERAGAPDRRRMAETRSLRLTANLPPDDTATAVYGPVWFSSRPVESTGEEAR